MALSQLLEGLSMTNPFGTLVNNEELMWKDDRGQTEIKLLLCRRIIQPQAVGNSYGVLGVDNLAVVTACLFWA